MHCYVSKKNQRAMRNPGYTHSVALEALFELTKTPTHQGGVLFESERKKSKEPRNVLLALPPKRVGNDLAAVSWQ